MEWSGEGRPAVIAMVVAVERSGPKPPGAAMAIADDGAIAGSVTGGCVEPDLVVAAESVMQTGQAIVRDYGIADDDAFAVGLPCGGAVRIVLMRMDPIVVDALAAAVDVEATLGLITPLAGPHVGVGTLVGGDDADDEIAALIRRGECGIVGSGDGERFVLSVAPKPRMYIFGAVDFAAALATVGAFLGYHVTVSDARGMFVTRERFPDAHELVVSWPHMVIAESHVDERSAICVLTHDAKFDVPALQAALATDAGYIGAMGSKRTTARREERLREDGATDAELARIHAPIGLSIRSKTPQEVAVAIGAEIIQTMRARAASSVSVNR
jgi:xanthine dehydrogenase accessory factor